VASDNTSAAAIEKISRVYNVVVIGAGSADLANGIDDRHCGVV
jgi:hypothetical protein